MGKEDEQQRDVRRYGGTSSAQRGKIKMCKANRKKTPVTYQQVCVSIIILLFLLYSFSPVLGDENRKRYLFETTYNKEVVTRYDQIEQIKVLTYSKLGAMQPAEVIFETESWVRLVWKTIDCFNGVQNLSNSKNPEDHIRALSEVYSVRQTIEELEDKAPSSAIVLLSNIALDRVLSEEAEYLEDAANHESQTKKRIEYLTQSAKAFQESGDISNFARLDYEVKELSARYNEDMQIANDLLSNAKRMSSAGMIAKTSTFLPLDPFLNYKESKGLANQALDIYEKHSDEKTKEAYSLKNLVEAEFADVVVEMIWKLMLYSLILFVIGTYVLRSVSMWRDDLTNSRLANVLIR